MRLASTIGSTLVLCSLTLGCKPPATAEDEDEAGKAETKPAQASEPSAEPEPEPAADGTEPTASEPIPKWTGDDRDPSWYHPSIIPGATELANTGSDVTGEGSLSRVLRLQLPADSTPEGCIDQLRQAVASGTDTEIPAAKTLPDGRLQVTGAIEGENYRYTLMCGQVEDKVVAFVGYYLD